MITKNMPIDFVREVIEKELLYAHIEDDKYVGGKNQINLFSFYEQVQNQEQVDRYVDRFRDLTKQANRSHLISNGILLAPENPTITNLYSHLIVPMTFACNFRQTLQDRDTMIDTFNNLFERLKGKSVNVAELEDKSLFYLPKIGNKKSSNGQGMLPQNGLFIGKDYQWGVYFYKQIEKTYTSLSQLTTNKRYFLGDVGSIKQFFENKTYQYMHIFSNQSNGIIQAYISQNQDKEKNLEWENSLSGKCLAITSQVIYTFEPDAPFVPIMSVSWSSIPDTYRVFIDFTNSADITVAYNNLTDLIKGVLCQMDSIVNILLDTFNLPVSYYEENPIEYVYVLSTTNFIRTMVIDEETNYESVFMFRTYSKASDKDKPIIVPNKEGYASVLDFYKLSLSFDSMRVENPVTLNGTEECIISFGGSATLVDKHTKLGNDLVEVSFQKKKIVMKNSDFVYTGGKYYFEPLELPSGNSIETGINQLRSNKFVKNSIANGMGLSLQYTFVLDRLFSDNDLLHQWFEYARYGINGVEQNKVSPNTIYEIVETWSANGEVKKYTFLGKIVESIDIENNENDVMTITIPIQIQGENN